MGSSHFGQGQVKGHMQLKNLDLPRMHLKVKLVINSRVHNTTFPTTTTIESTSSRQLTIYGGPDEAATNKQFGVPAKYELQQNAILVKHGPHHPRPQDLANTVSHLQSAGSSNLPSGNASIVTLRSGRELPQPAPQQASRSTDVDFEPDANSQVPQQDRSVPLSFPTRTLLTRKPESDEELLKMFWKILKYTKILKELCVHKRQKMKGGVELGGIVSTLTRNDEFTVGVQQALPKKC
ncbi:hypothetical protein CR513_33400, partial [Mucuna pruriens]